MLFYVSVAVMRVRCDDLTPVVYAHRQFAHSLPGRVKGCDRPVGSSYKTMKCPAVRQVISRYHTLIVNALGLRGPRARNTKYFYFAVGSPHEALPCTSDVRVVSCDNAGIVDRRY